MSDKIDTHAKADIINDLREQQIEREKNLSVLRVTSTTIILVPRKSRMKSMQKTIDERRWA